MAQLRRHKDELQAAGVQVVLISFGADDWAREWMKENGFDDPILVDPDRKVYGLYGLQHSVRHSLSLRVIWFYLTRIGNWMRIRKGRGDPYQRGGDFLVSHDGTLLLVHPSTDATDRPTVEAILEAVEQSPEKP